MATLAAAQTPASYRTGDIAVEAPWSRATPGGAKVAGGYMRITNTGAQPDRLLAGSTAAAGGFKVHRSSMSNGVARVEPVTSVLELGPKETVLPISMKISTKTSRRPMIAIPCLTR
jgi:periplasmic copper chaperone A